MSRGLYFQTTILLAILAAKHHCQPESHSGYKWRDSINRQKSNVHATTTTNPTANAVNQNWYKYYHYYYTANHGSSPGQHVGNNAQGGVGNRAEEAQIRRENGHLHPEWRRYNSSQMSASSQTDSQSRLSQKPRLSENFWKSFNVYSNRADEYRRLKTSGTKIGGTRTQQEVGTHHQQQHLARRKTANRYSNNHNYNPYFKSRWRGGSNRTWTARIGYNPVTTTTILSNGDNNHVDGGAGGTKVLEGNDSLTTNSSVKLNLLSMVAKRNAKSSGVNYRQVEKQILDSILAPEVYDSRMRPSGKNTTSGATVVNVNLYIRSFEKIDDVKMEYSVQITFRQQWNDNRLVFDNKNGKIKYLTMTEQSKVWMPDTFFRNEKGGRFHQIIQPNLYVRVFPDGDVLYSIRVSLTLACPMNLKLFPLDTQTCHLRVASYGWTIVDLEYAWKHPPVETVKDLFLPGGFEFANISNSFCNVKTATGEYSCLSVDMIFKRQLSYYIVTIYVPTFMIVCVSWMSFWLDHKSAPARVALTVTTLLAMSTTTSSINNSLPPVAYTKAIDVWSNMCVSYVFLALLEYALVNYAARADARTAAARVHLEKELEFVQKEQSMHYAVSDNKEPVEDLDPHIRRIEGASYSTLLFAQLVPYELSVRSVLSQWPLKHEPGAKKIDVLSRIMFPMSFMGLNVMYWSYYLTRHPAHR